MTLVTFNCKIIFDYKRYLYIIEINNITQGHYVKHLLVDGILLDMETLRVISTDNNNNHHSIRLSKAEANILFFLFKNKGEIVSKEKLIVIGWEDRKVGTNSMNVAIYNLRKCFNHNENISLDNIPKIGYKLSISEAEVFTENDVNTADMETIDDRLTDKKEIITEKKLVNNKLFHVAKLSSMVLINLVIIKFLFIFYINLVTVDCIKSAQGTACYSESYQGDRNITSRGISVLSNLFSFTNPNILREGS